MLSFRNRLLILLIGLVVGAQTVTLFTALASTRSTERDRANVMLEQGATYARQQLDTNAQQLAMAVGVLSKDYGLNTAVASQEEPTIASALDSFAGRINADLLLALDPDGKLLAQAKGTASADDELVTALNRGDERSSGGAQFVMTATGVYQVFTEPLIDGIGQVAAGFAVDRLFADKLHKGSGVQIAFLTAADGTSRLAASSIESWQKSRGMSVAPLPATPEVVSIGGVEYLATTKPLSEGRYALSIALLKPMDEVRAPFLHLAFILSLIIGITLAAAVIAGVYLGRSAARPVQSLAAGAARVAAGDYSEPVAAAGGQELAHLADSFNSMQSGIAERESQLLYVARHDAATGLPNRLRMEEWLTLRLSPHGTSYAVVQMVVTNLQEISASLGFQIAESLVSHLAQQLRAWVAGRGLVARLDATTFVVAIELQQQSEAESIAQQLRACSAAAFTTAGITLQAAVVLGVAVVPRDARTATETLRCAHAAVEAAVMQRVDVAHFAASSDAAQRRRLKLGADLPLALAAGQLHLHFQPKARLADRRVSSVEALLRWRHPEFGNVSPMEFIPIAERTGASGSLTRWVLQSALAQLAQWHRDGFPLEMAINLSAADILDVNLVQHILEALRHVKVPAGSLTLEITESVLLHEPEAARRNMEMLRVAGIRFSIDDFGTGYSSLSQLRELPADELKIDQSFVRGSLRGAEQVAVLRAIIDMAHGLGLRTVAEGVETDEQWQLLADLGCHHAQGYLISRPAPAGELLPLLQASGVSRTDGERTTSLRVLELRRREPSSRA